MTQAHTTIADQRPPDQDPYDDEESEDDFDLRDVSSDVEVDPNELDILSEDEGCVLITSAVGSC